MTIWASERCPECRGTAISHLPPHREIAYWQCIECGLQFDLDGPEGGYVLPDVLFVGDEQYIEEEVL